MPVSAITAFGNSRVRKKLKEMGCLFCLDKPFNIEELLYQVVIALGEREPIGSLKDSESGA